MLIILLVLLLPLIYGNQYNTGHNASPNQYQQYQQYQQQQPQQQQHHQHHQHHHHQQQQQQQQSRQITSQSSPINTQITNFNTQHNHGNAFNEIFYSIDKLTREQVTSFAYDCLSKVIRINDQCSNRYPYNNNHINNIFQETSTIINSNDNNNNNGNSLLKQLIEKLSLTSFNIRNLTIIIALVYLDKVSQKLLIFANSNNVRKLFGGCLMISSKLHTNELSRDALADIMNINVQELLVAEATITQAITDLTIHPQVLINYVKPLLGTNIYAPNQN